jgi:hypothetical protein
VLFIRKHASVCVADALKHPTLRANSSEAASTGAVPRDPPAHGARGLPDIAITRWNRPDVTKLITIASF